VIFISSYLKKFLGGKRFDDDDDLIYAVQKWLTSQAAATTNASIIAANMWKNIM